jgi:hypothetical protein
MIKTTLLALTLAGGAATLASASGTYLPPSGRIPSKRPGAMDDALYALGQKTFEGKLTSPGAGSMASQKKALAVIQATIPAGSGDVTKLAGNITNEQLKALQYFVSKRFGR